MGQKATDVEKQMEWIGKTAKEEFYKSTSSVVEGLEARMQEKAKGREIPFKSDVKAKFPPCLNFGADGRKLGVGAKTEQPPATQADQ